MTTLALTELLGAPVFDPDGSQCGRVRELAIEGDIAGKDCLLRYKRNGRALAVASIYRDVESLRAEVAMEREAA